MSLLCRALSRVILRLHLHRECSREGEGNKLKHTPAVPQEAMCEIYIQSFINHFICYAWVISVCNALKREPEAVICSVNRSPPPRLPRYQVWSVSVYFIIKLLKKNCGGFPLFIFVFVVVSRQMYILLNKTHHNLKTQIRQSCWCRHPSDVHPLICVFIVYLFKYSFWILLLLFHFSVCFVRLGLGTKPVKGIRSFSFLFFCDESRPSYMIG